MLAAFIACDAVYDDEELMSQFNELEVQRLLSCAAFVYYGGCVYCPHEKILYCHVFQKSEFELIQGDISITSKHFSENNPGFKISLLYMDLDLEQPTYDTLNNLWDNITKGGIIVFDEYGYHKWSESRGVDKFIEEKNLQIRSLDYSCPTAYIVK